MFTGIIEEIGTIKNIKKGKSSIVLEITCAKALQNAKIGDSIAVNGICLTVTTMDTKFFTADVMPETMAKTNLGNLRIGDAVNLEPALTLQKPLGGHLVSGHIDGTGQIIGCEKEDNAILLSIKASEDILKYIIPKGSVAVDGTSLTVAKLTESHFMLSLIPHTMRNTILQHKKIGDKVNIECDMIGKYIERFFMHQKASAPSSGITLDVLGKNGFL